MTTSPNIGIHMHSYPGSWRDELTSVASQGVTVIRMDTNWNVLQEDPGDTAFDPNTLLLNETEYGEYLVARGYTLNGNERLAWVVDDIRVALEQGIEVIYNFGVTPYWADNTTVSYLPDDPQLAADFF